MEEAGVPGENYWPAASHGQTLSHNVVSSTGQHEGFNDHLDNWPENDQIMSVLTYMTMKLRLKHLTSKYHYGN